MPEEGPRTGASSARLMGPRAALSVLNNVIGAVLGTTALVFIAKNMGPNVMGVLGYSMASIGVLSFLSDFGAGSVHRMLIKSGEDIGKCVGAYAAIRLVLLGVFAGITLLLIQLWRMGTLDGASSGEQVVVESFEVFLVYYVLLGVSQIATHTFDATDAVAKVYLPSIVELVVRVSFIIYVASTALGRGEDGAAWLASGYVLGILVAAALSAALLSNVKMSRPDRAILAKYVRSLAPVFVVSMIIILELYLDKVFVGYFWGDYQVGLYFGVQRMAIFVSVFSLAIATMILPSVTTYYSRKDVAASWDVVNQAERYVSLVVIPTAAFYLTWGSEILRVFLTSTFATAVNTMYILVVSSTLVALVLPLRSAIVGVGSSRTLFWVGAGAVLIQVILMLLLVPDELFGLKTAGMKATGAAMALLASSVYSFFTLRYMAWKTAKIVPNARSFRHLVSAVFMIGVMYVVRYLFIPSIDGLALILLAAVGVGAYALTAYMMGELEPSDYRYFRSMVNPQGTYQYVVNELLGRRAH